LRIRETAQRGAMTLGDDAGEFFERLPLYRLRNNTDRRHFTAEQLDLGFVELLQYVGCRFRANDHEKDGELLLPVGLEKIDVRHFS